MFLLVLDKDAVKSAQLVPEKIKFKQLIELCQLICSTGISNIYKPIKQGKELQKWVDKNIVWVLNYFIELKKQCYDLKLNIKEETKLKLETILNHIINECYDRNLKNINTTTTAIFRYSKDYECNISTDTELPIDECIEQYKKYIIWKKEKGVKGYE